MQTTVLNNQGSINWARFNSTFVIEVNRGGEVYTSTAVALSNKMLLTAAHCVDCAKDVNIIIGEDYHRPVANIQVSHWIIHPGYNPSKSFYENDIAVIYLEEELPYFTGTEVIPSELLLEDDAQIERIGFGGRANKNIRTWTSLSFESVTYNKKNLVFKDKLSVVGDSGGPIYQNISGRLQLIALHSTLEGEDKTYGVNLAYYKDWIDTQIDLQAVV